MWCTDYQTSGGPISMKEGIYNMLNSVIYCLYSVCEIDIWGTFNAKQTNNELHPLNIAT